jgi:hypothetical protein
MNNLLLYVVAIDGFRRIDMGSGGLRGFFEIKPVLMLIGWYAPFRRLRVASVQDVCGG